MKNRSLFVKNMILIILPIIIVSVVLVLILRSVVSDYFREDSYNRLDRELVAIENTVITSSEGEATTPPGLSPSGEDTPSASTPANQTDTPSVSTPANRKETPPGGGLPNGSNISRVGEDDDDTQTRPQVPAEAGHGAGWSPNLNVTKTVQTSFIVRVGKSHFKVLGEDDSIEAFELDQIIDNELWPLEGETSSGDDIIFYSIMPVTNEKTLNSVELNAHDELYHIAYISESYSSELSQVVMEVFIIGLGCLIILVSLIVFYVFRRMTNRIKILEEGANEIGKGNYSTVLNVEPYDEIGRLSDAMNKTSRQLSLIQEEQADHFQMISHELKTPIMVMEGYLDALMNDQYPNGTKEATYKVLNDELIKLENLTKDIIVLNKMDYLSKNKVEMETLSLRDLFEDTSKRLNTDDQIDIIIKGEQHLIGDKESWLHVIENIMTNNLRYAASRIIVTIDDDISIRNDGPHIEEQLLPRIKKPFVKGKSGRSGLGLAIVVNILKLYGYELEVKNLEMGVEYSIKRK